MASSSISILIPVFNYNVVPLVNAILDQAKEIDIAFEISIAEDASTKYTSENSSLKELQNVSYHYSEKNEGRAFTRDFLAKKANHDWLLFLDADVMPVNEDFLKTYSQYVDKNNDVLCGGIAYKTEKPAPEYMLRWKYGREREEKLAEKRNSQPYHVVSANIMIKKSMFLATNLQLQNQYGLDNYFSYNLKMQKAHVLHIDNPVYHLGLEKNAVFLDKALNAVATTVLLENIGILKSDQRPLQISYLKLKKYGAVGIFNILMRPFSEIMQKNFHSDSPNLFWFDLYRLHDYIQLKKKKNA